MKFDIKWLICYKNSYLATRTGIAYEGSALKKLENQNKGKGQSYREGDEVQVWQYNSQESHSSGQNERLRKEAGEICEGKKGETSKENSDCQKIGEKEKDRRQIEEARSEKSNQG
ncbi:MAG: hypothetical protein L0220_32365 [Acidobacteria bacterium]|nr:hypothetical protein [Acidobacteriota bacterium]